MKKQEIEKILEKDSLLDHLRRYYGKDSVEYKRRYGELYAELAAQSDPQSSGQIRKECEEAEEEDERIAQGY